MVNRTEVGYVAAQLDTVERLPVRTGGLAEINDPDVPDSGIGTGALSAGHE